MTERLAWVGHVAEHNGKLISLKRGDEVPRGLVKQLKDLGALESSRPSEDAESDSSEDEGGGSPGSIDVGSADTEAIAKYIADGKLNAADTIALAGNDPVLAQRVLDAENHGAGGDGRTTVVTPLQGIIDAANQ